ncbi:MAG: beta-ketoacyl synthase [Algicola sp.]|nr:beta-ketoacyl synthase [Algicola sp.]
MCLLKQPISITALASISPLGSISSDIWNHYNHHEHCFSSGDEGLLAKIKPESRQDIDHLKNANLKYKSLDDSVLFAIYAARKAIKNAQWDASDNFGINIGSSRGATSLFENYHKQFLEQQSTETLTSPTTTLGNISSWVAHDLQTNGPEISHSITCSTALHAMLNGIAWIAAGMTDKFLVGGSEAPLTPFTIAQMKALKIYARPENNLNKLKDSPYPNQALNIHKKHNGMILGEGAAVACLEPGIKPSALAHISGIGYATELLEHGASLSANATCFQQSMRMALGDLSPDAIDIIVTHTPGTIKGDQAELNAIDKIFCNKTPALTTNKWKIGHSLGASGLFSVEMAILMLQHQKFIPVPYLKSVAPKHIKYILINAVGFGGNAVSILLSK